MIIEELSGYRAVAYRNCRMEMYYDAPQRIVDEGSFLRIGELHIIEKFGICGVEKDGNRVLIGYDDGKFVEVTVLG